MNNKAITILSLAAIVLLSVAGTKVSKLTRTQTFTSNDLFIVVTGSTAKVTRHIRAKDLAEGLGPWLTNASMAGGSATNAVTSTNGNQFLGVPLSIKSGSLETNKLLFASAAGAVPVKIYAAQNQSADLLQLNDYLGNSLFQVGGGGVVRIGSFSDVEITLSGIAPKQNGSSILTNLSATGATTNKFNSWQIWCDPVVTNVYHAENRGIGIKTNSVDLSALFRSMLNRGTEGFSYELIPNPYFTNAYVMSNTVVITNWGTIMARSAGNPAVTIRAAPGFTNYLFQLGDYGKPIGGISSWRDIRLEGDQGATNSGGIRIVNCVEPIFDSCEFTGFKGASLHFDSTNKTHWSYTANNWFVSKWSSHIAILFSAQPVEDVTLNHFSVNNSTFGGTLGRAIVISNLFPNITIANNTFFGQLSGGIDIYGGAGMKILYNKFLSGNYASPIYFQDRAAATNMNADVFGNSMDTGGPVVALGTFVQGVRMGDNSSAGGTDPVLLSGDNGAFNNLDQTGLRIGSLTITNRVVFANSSGVIGPVTGTSAETEYVKKDGTVGTPSGTGGTNNPVTLTGGPLAVIASQTARYYTNAAGNFSAPITGTPNASAMILFAVSNSISSPIFITNTAGFYDERVGSNVTTLAVAGYSQASFLLRRNATSGWDLGPVSELLATLAAGSGISLTTNSTVITLASSGGMTNNGLTNATIVGLVAGTSAIKTVTAGSNITITDRGTNLMFAATGGTGTGVDVTNVFLYTSASTNLIIDLGLASTNHVNFKIGMLTNSHIVFSNKTLMKFPVDITWQQDTNGNRAITSMRSTDGLVQTNGFVAITTNVNARDIWTVKDSLFSTNLTIDAGYSGALLSTSTNLIVVGTRYTNGPLRSMVSASFTLTATATGVATVSLFVERTGVTNSLQISAGPLAALVTVEPLIQLVGPGEIFYFTDESASGGTVAIVPKTSSKVDLQ